jgi:hypothetical protein
MVSTYHGDYHLDTPSPAVHVERCSHSRTLDVCHITTRFTAHHIGKALERSADGGGALTGAVYGQSLEDQPFISDVVP